MNVEEAGELCCYFVNELSFSNLIECFVLCMYKLCRFVVIVYCAVMLMHSLKCVI